MNLPDTRTLLLAFDKGVLRVTLNRPDARNALNLDMIADLNRVFDLCQQSTEVRALILRGAGGHFCAGADLKEMMAGGMKQAVAGAADPVVTFSRSFGSMLRSVGRIPAVVIA
ncbi:MAG: enoyl-CoA hydratase/isomerase family protein, partial [Nevskia sp.]|nr:enoyl-CoA hydratase/isomerase family protein [Nevskia sp.]